MSRVGQLPVAIPDGVEVRVDGGRITASGRLGELSMAVPPAVEVVREDGALRVAPADDSKRARAMWGTARSLVGNLVAGVSRGFEKRLRISGVGYRAQMQGGDLVLQLGHSHEIRYPGPGDVGIETPSQTEIVVSGMDRQRVGQVAAEIRRFRPPEPYKGKGVRYSDEVVVRKEGKKK